MELNESQLKEVYDVLREKLLVMREGSTGIVNVTPGNERYFPERSKIILGMPLASSKVNLSLDERPKAIQVNVGRKMFSTFSLLPLCELKAIGALDVSNDKKKSLMEKYNVRSESSCVPVVKTFHVHLPYQKRHLNYSQMIARLTVELYGQYLSRERSKIEESLAVEHFDPSFKAKLGKSSLKFNKAHEQNIQKGFFDFLKSFDAIELTSWSEVPPIGSYKGFENFDEKLDYASYNVSFWKFPVTVADKGYGKQKISKAEEQLICLKRAVFKKAHIKMDEGAELARLPLVASGNGKDDKAV